MKLYRNLIIVFAVILALVGGIFAVSKINTSSDEPTPSEVPVSDTITVFNVDSNTITKVSVKTEENEYYVSKSDGKLTLSNSAGLRLAESKIQSLIYSCSAVSATKEVSKNPEDAHIYGFDNVTKSVTVHTNDGNKKTILIGDMTLDNKNAYIKMEDEDTVYLKSIYGVESLTPRYTDFVDKTILTVDNSNLAPLEHVHITKKGNMAIKLDYLTIDTRKHWKMTAPVYSDVNGQVLSEYILTPLESFSAVDVAEAHVSDPSKYGFNDPYAVFSIKYDNQTTKLIFGMNYNNYRFVMINGYDSVYTVKESSVSFLDVPYQNLMSRLIHVEYIDQISKVEISGLDSSITMEIDGDKYKINGKRIEKKAFSRAYQAIIGISLDSVDLNITPTNNYDATIKYTKNDGSTVVVGFISKDDRNYHAVVDGKGNSITAKKNFKEAVDFVIDTYKKAK